MIANSDLRDLSTNDIDPIAAMQSNPMMMETLWREVSRVAASEIGRGPVPEGATATQMGQVGRNLRRSGGGLTADTVKSPQVMMRVGGNVQKAVQIASRTNRPNMGAIVQMAAQRARQVALATNDFNEEERLRQAYEQRMAMKRRMAMMTGAAVGLGDEVKDKAKEHGLFGPQSGNHALGHLLAHMVFPKQSEGMDFKGETPKMTNPVSGMIDRVMGRDPASQPSMSMDAPSYEMSLDAPAPPKAAPSTPAMRM